MSTQSVPVVVEWAAMGTPGRALATIAASLAVGAAVTAAAGAGGIRMGTVPVVAVCSAAALAINWAVYVPSYLARTERFYDLTGSLTYLCVVALALVFGNGDPRSVLLAVLIAIWATRLGSFLFLRIRRDGSDGRFDRIKLDPVRFAMSWTMQALWVVLTASAALAAMTTGRDVDPGWFVAPGVVVWALGFGIEVMADAQKRAFRSDPANRGRFITTGLWAWSRHPKLLRRDHAVGGHRPDRGAGAVGLAVRHPDLAGVRRGAPLTDQRRAAARGPGPAALGRRSRVPRLPPADAGAGPSTASGLTADPTRVALSHR